MDDKKQIIINCFREMESVKILNYILLILNRFLICVIFIEVVFVADGECNIIVQPHSTK